ncbi:chorismate mutase [Ferrimonas pelagia]|uniref:Chorismate mutase n=1 Tax=Ferrimonas pelagia TaxID=1177826 RepID=A0ABP9FAD2_9GAMM
MTQEHPLDPIRRQITALDRQLLELLAQRRELSLDVARTKADVTKPVRDSDRESALLTRLVSEGRQLGLDGQYVSRLFHAIIEDSVLRQQAWFQSQHNPAVTERINVAYLGAKGSYSYLASHSYFERRALELNELGQSSFNAILDTVEQGQADYGVIPIENTSSGSINEVFDLLQHTNLHIVGETTESIPHCVLLPEGGALSEIKTVFAHPQVHAQCSRYLAELNVHQEYCASSAEAMSKAAQTPNSAAIASERGGALYGLHVAKRDLANQPRNETRFLVLARKPVDVPPQVPAKTTLLMATGQQPGALVEALSVLRDNGVNMTKLESRPIHGNPWEEMFYLDVQANLHSQPMQQALRDLTRLTRFVKVLGCYPCETVLPTELDSHALAHDPRLSDETPLHSRTHKARTSPIRIGHQQLGDGSFRILAGPAHHSMEANEIARTVKEYAGAALWGSHDQDEASLRTHAKLCQQLGLPLVGELTAAERRPLLSEYCDLLLLGPGALNEPALLAAAGQDQRPVILIRPEQADGQALLDAAEIILQQGNQQVILCEPGQREGDRPRLDLAMVAWLKQHSHLPVLLAPDCDSQHLALDLALIQAAKTAGADGLLLAIQPQFDAAALAQLMAALYR